MFTYKKGNFTREDEEKVNDGVKAIAAQHTVCLKVIVPVFIILNISITVFSHYNLMSIRSKRDSFWRG
jgi:hypothetical protein